MLILDFENPHTIRVFFRSSQSLHAARGNLVASRTLTTGTRSTPLILINKLRARTPSKHRLTKLGHIAKTPPKRRGGDARHKARPKTLGRDRQATNQKKRSDAAPPADAPQHGRQRAQTRPVGPRRRERLGRPRHRSQGRRLARRPLDDVSAVQLPALPVRQLLVQAEAAQAVRVHLDLSGSG